MSGIHNHTRPRVADLLWWALDVCFGDIGFSCKMILGAFYALDWHPCEFNSVMGVESDILSFRYAKKSERIPRRGSWTRLPCKKVVHRPSRLRNESVSPNTQKKKKKYLERFFVASRRSLSPDIQRNQDVPISRRNSRGPRLRRESVSPNTQRKIRTVSQGDQVEMDVPISRLSPLGPSWEGNLSRQVRKEINRFSQGD